MLVFFILLFVSLVYAKSIYPHTSEDEFHPFVTPSQSRRICTELCMSGLGGKPCGDSCMDITPQALPVQSSSDKVENEKTPNQTRYDACTILCPNQLGYPFCECDDSTKTSDVDFRVDFVQICSYYCLQHKYRLYGCQSCQIYENAQAKYKNDEVDTFKRKGKLYANGIDWEKWCKQQCSVGNGGAACNCDILPFSIRVEPEA